MSLFWDLWVNTDLERGDVRHLVSALRSGEVPPETTLKMLADMLDPDTKTDWSLVPQHRKGPRKPDDLMEREDIGRRVNNAIDGPGTVEAAIVQIMQETGKKRTYVTDCYALYRDVRATYDPPESVESGGLVSRGNLHRSSDTFSASLEALKEMKVQYLRYKDIKDMGLVNNRTTLSRWVKYNGFPKPNKLSKNCAVYPRDKVIAWVESRVQGGA
jgi:predicted DNA-binding transcriptional regulator AlpA